MRSETFNTLKAEAANIRDRLQQTSLPAQPEQRGLLIEATWYALEIGTLFGLQAEYLRNEYNSGNH